MKARKGLTNPNTLNENSIMAQYTEAEHKTIVGFIKLHQLDDLFEFSDKPNGSRLIAKIRKSEQPKVINITIKEMVGLRADTINGVDTKLLKEKLTQILTEVINEVSAV